MPTINKDDDVTIATNNIKMIFGRLYNNDSQLVTALENEINTILVDLDKTLSHVSREALFESSHSSAHERGLVLFGRVAALKDLMSMINAGKESRTLGQGRF